MEFDKRFHINIASLADPFRCGSVFVYQIGKMHCSPSTVIDAHYQGNYLELTIATDGEGTSVSNGVAETLKRGDIYFSIPGDIHEIRSSAQNPLKYDFLSLTSTDSDLSHSLADIFAGFSDPAVRKIKDERIQRLLSDALSEVIEPTAHHEKLLESALDQLLIYFINDLQKISATHSVGVSKNDELCYNVMRYIDTHVYSLRNLDELPEVFNYSYNYLTKIFKETTAITLSSYFLTKKMEVAKTLVNNPKLSISEISDMLNYASVYSFSKSFRSYFGHSPMKERNRSDRKTETP